jgi:hypothetical protein
MKVAQRNGTAVTQAPHSGYAGPDRWKTFASGGGAYTITQDSGHQADTGHDKALKIAVTTADTSIAAGDVYSFLTRIESNSLQHLQYGTSSAKSLTFSFWVRATKTGTQAVFFSKQGTGTDYNHIKEFTINASNTWEHKTITIPGLTASTMINDASTYIQAGWILKYGSAYHGTKDSWRTDSDFTTSAAVNNMDSTSNTFYVTGVQLEVGDRATDFEHRSFAEELQLCKRYYQEYQACAQEWIYVEGNGAAYKWWQNPIKVPMRATPTTTHTGFTGASFAGSTVSTLTRQGISANRVSWRVTLAGAAGNAYEIRHTDQFDQDKIHMDAEL